MVAAPWLSGDSELRNGEVLCCLALAIGLMLAGCQTSGTNEAPRSTANGSPFSAAATYNRQNTGDMGLTLYDGAARAKAAPPPVNPPIAAPGASAAPPAVPGTVCPPPGSVYPTAGPITFSGNGAAPNIVGAAPAGYWIYQPANGSPVTNQNGGPQYVVPVYGPPINAYPGYGATQTSGIPVAPYNMPSYPVQGTANSMNYPPMAAVSAPGTPCAGSTPIPPSAMPGGQPLNSPGYGAPAISNPQVGIAPLYVPGGFVTGSPTTATAPVPGDPGTFLPR